MLAFNPSLRRYLPIYIAILLLFVATRWINLFGVPIFVDEMWGINLTRDVLHGITFAALPFARWLDTLIWSIFKPLGPESIWVSRAVTSLLATMACAAAMKLAAAAGSPRAGMLAGLIYVVLPYSVFYDRQILGDPISAAFVSIVFVCSFRLARRPELLNVIVTTLALAAAFLSKFIGVLYVLTPLLAAVLLASQSHRKRAILAASAAIALCLTAILIVFIVADRFLPDYQSILQPEYDWNWKHEVREITSVSLIENWRDVLGLEFGPQIVFYFGWTILVVVLYSGRYIGIAPQRRGVTWLWLAGVGVYLPFLLATSWLPGRYMAALAAILSVLAGIGLSRLLESVIDLNIPQVARRGAQIGLALAVILWPVPRSAGLLLDPTHSRIPGDEYRGYFGDDSVRGLADVRQALMEIYATQSGPIDLIFDGVSYMSLSPYWGGYTGELRAWEDSLDLQAVVASWLLAGHTVAYLDVGDLPVAPHGNRVEVVGMFAGVEGRIYRLRVLREPGPVVLRLMYEHSFGNPYGIEDQYRQLADQLVGGQVVIAYPAHQAELLSQLSSGRAVQVIPIGEGWPLDLDATYNQLRSISTDYEKLTVIFFNETAGDPQRQIEYWLNTHLYWQAERWVGALRVIDYLTAPTGMKKSQPGIIFDNRLVIDRAQTTIKIVGEEQFILVMLDLHATTEITQSYKIGLYVFDESNNLVAQYDAIPVAGLSPTTGWSANTSITHRCAIRLPDGAADGRYVLRLALYEETSLIRLRATNVEGQPDMVDLDTFMMSGD